MARRHAQRIGALYGAWNHRPADVEALCELHQAIEDNLREVAVTG